MSLDEVLALAVERALITAAQAEALHKLAAEPPAPAASSSPAVASPVVAAPDPAVPVAAAPSLAPAIAKRAGDAEARDEAQAMSVDDEKLRFISGFADIFVALGLILFFSSSAYLIDAYAGDLVMWAGLVALSWLIAEFFTRRHRMALPSIILLGLFSASVFMATTKLVAALDPTAPVNWWHPVDRQSWMLLHAGSFTLAGLVTAAAAGLHYERFRVPITIAAMAAALVATVVSLAYWLMPAMNGGSLDGLLFVLGLLIFLLAMRFDMSDLERRTRRTDIAFWLHLLAAPLIVHPLIAHLGRNGAVLDTYWALVVLAIFVVLGLVSLLIDRRALLVSGLAYAGVAFGTLLQHTGFTDKTPAATLLALGFFILGLSAGWHALRGALLRLLPAALVIRLPRSHVSVS